MWSSRALARSTRRAPPRTPLYKSAGLPRGRGERQGVVRALSNFASGARSHVVTAIPTSAPAVCATTNIGAFEGAIPEKVSVNERATVTAGFAKEVEAVNQY